MEAWKALLREDRGIGAGVRIPGFAHGWDPTSRTVGGGNWHKCRALKMSRGSQGTPSSVSEFYGKVP